LHGFERPQKAISKADSTSITHAFDVRFSFICRRCGSALVFTQTYKLVAITSSLTTGGRTGDPPRESHFHIYIIPCTDFEPRAHDSHAHDSHARMGLKSVGQADLIVNLVGVLDNLTVGHAQIAQKAETPGNTLGVQFATVLPESVISLFYAHSTCT